MSNTSHRDARRERADPNGVLDDDMYQFDADYHGNMNEKKFESWFTHLCEICRQNFGPCVIILDECLAHKRLQSPII